MISAGYVDLRAERLPLNRNIKLPPVGPGSVQARRPYYSQYPLLTSVTMISNLGEKTYDSAQFKVDRRYSHGLTVSSSLTWAHAQQSALAPWNNYVFQGGHIPAYGIRLQWG